MTRDQLYLDDVPWCLAECDSECFHEWIIRSLRCSSVSHKKEFGMEREKAGGTQTPANDMQDGASPGRFAAEA